MKLNISGTQSPPLTSIGRMLEESPNDRRVLSRGAANRLELRWLRIEQASFLWAVAMTCDLRLHKPALVTTEPLADKGDRSPNTSLLVDLNEIVREPYTHSFQFPSARFNAQILQAFSHRTTATVPVRHRSKVVRMIFSTPVSSYRWSGGCAFR
jgi:hypothetical protein